MNIDYYNNYVVDGIKFFFLFFFTNKFVYVELDSKDHDYPFFVSFTNNEKICFYSLPHMSYPMATNIYFCQDISYTVQRCNFFLTSIFQHFSVQEGRKPYREARGIKISDTLLVQKVGCDTLVIINNMFNLYFYIIMSKLLKTLRKLKDLQRKPDVRS